jgi:hypothetical protein
MKTSFAVLVLAGSMLLASSAFAKKQRPPAGPIVKWKEVPGAVQAAVQANAGDAKVKEVRRGTANGMVFYCVEIKAADGKWSKMYVKEDGTFMRTEPDKARNNRKHKPLFGG